MRKVLRIILWILGGIFFLLLFVIIAINTPAGKNFIRKKAVAFLHDKLKTEVIIGNLDYGLPKFIVLENVLFRDEAKDTLLAARKIKININMLKLIRSTVDVNELNLEGIKAHIYRNRLNTVFNFDYIIRAFASKEPDTSSVKDTSSGGLKINLDRLVLNDIRFHFDDYAGGSRFALQLDTLRLTMNNLDIDELSFDINKMFIAGVNSSFIQDTSYLPPAPPPDNGPLQLKLAAEELDLHRIAYFQESKLSKFLMDIKAGRLSAHPHNIDLSGQEIAVKDLMLDKASVKILMGKTAVSKAVAKADTVITEPEEQPAPWKILAGAVKLDHINFIMDNENEPHQPSGIDYAHLNVQQLAFYAQQILYTTDTIAGTITHFTATEQSGLNVHELKTRFAYYPQGGMLRDLYLQTNNSILQNYAAVRYPSLPSISKNPGLIKISLGLEKSIVGLNDVLLFAPQLEQQDFFKKNKYGKFRLEAAMNGSLGALSIQKLYLAGLGNTQVSLKGSLGGLPDANKLNCQLQILKLQSSRNDIETLLPPATLKQIRLPDQFGVTGNISGTAQTYKPNLLLVSSDGMATIKGMLSMAGGKGKEIYDISLQTKQFDVGHIIRDTSIGAVTADLTARGHSFDKKRADAVVSGNIHAATYNKYTYRNISFKGNAMAGKAQINLLSEDENARLHLNGKADLSKEYPSIVADLNIDSIDLQALHFATGELKMRALVHADIHQLNPDYPDGIITIDRPVVAANGNNYFLDSLYIVASPDKDSGNNIIIYAQAVKAHIWGHTPLTEIGNILQSQISRHYTLSDSIYKANQQKNIVLDSTIPKQYDFHLIAKVQQHPVIQAFAPALKTFDTVSINADITPSSILLEANAPTIVYGTSTIINTNVKVNGTDTALTYLATVRHLEQPSLDLWYTRVGGELSSNIITSDITSADADSNKRFALSAKLQRESEEQTLSLNRGLVLNYKEWEVNQPNQIVFSNKGLYVQNFGISKDNEYIRINSETPSFEAPLHADISNFLLSNITEIISKDTLLANGTLGGKIDIQQLNADPALTSTLQVTNLSMMGDTIGNLNIDVKNATSKQVNADIVIKGNGNNVELKGDYYPEPVNGNNFDMKLALDPLNVKTLEGAANYQIKNTTGNLKGDLAIQGTINAPRINGTLRTDNLSTNVAMLNSQFTFPSEVLRITPEAVNFDNFTILDSAGNKAIINGKVVTNDYRNMELALRLRANKWRTVNSTQKNNKDFYGKLFLSTNMSVEGPVAAPNVNGKVDILKGTSMTVTVPEREAAIEERDGIVEFVNIAHPDKYVMLTHPKDTTKKIARLPHGSEVNLNVELDENAEFNVIIDEGTGDFLKVKGKADLNTNVAPDGTLGLVGTYEIMDGSYQLNYNFIRRLFRIQSGSKIIFSGDPTQAEVNITAVYEANVPPYDLVEKQVADPAQLVYYKQRLPFEVNMKLSGQLLQPEISFDIVLPDNKTYRASSDVIDVVQGKLNDLRNNPSDLNKQVFALIILNRFVADNPFESDAGGGVEGIARQSASRFISEQLNKFAGNLITGLDLTLDLVTSEDYTTGEKRNRTDLNLSASKKLLNDRLTVTVGNNFQLEGPRTNASQNTSYIPGNLAVDYDLSTDRRYRVRVYRRNEEVGLDGFVIKTGASFIMTLDYNKFRYILMGKKKRKQLRQERRKQRMENNTSDTSTTDKVTTR